ncbi:MAG: hypothetical protein J7599_03060 [Niabella sp.]|nr:hypothetical protein [Niabella sp.]
MKYWFVFLALSVINFISCSKNTIKRYAGSEQGMANTTRIMNVADDIPLVLGVAATSKYNGYAINIALTITGATTEIKGTAQITVTGAGTQVTYTTNQKSLELDAIPNKQYSISVIYSYLQNNVVKTCSAQTNVTTTSTSDDGSGNKPTISGCPLSVPLVFPDPTQAPIPPDAGAYILYDWLPPPATGGNINVISPQEPKVLGSVQIRYRNYEVGTTSAWIYLPLQNLSDGATTVVHFPIKNLVGGAAYEFQIGADCVTNKQPTEFSSSYYTTAGPVE